MSLVKTAGQCFAAVYSRKRFGGTKTARIAEQKRERNKKQEAQLLHQKGVGHLSFPREGRASLEIAGKQERLCLRIRNASGIWGGSGYRRHQAQFAM